MAITKISDLTSNKFYPSQNPINVTVSSNNSGKCNFRFICDVYINSIKVFTDKLFPDPSTGYGFFQLTRVVQDYIQTSLPKTPHASVINAATSAAAPASAFSLQLKFGEEYDSSTTCDGVVNQYLNLATSNTAYVFETAIDYEDFPTFTANDYLVGTFSNTSTKFLTNSQREIDVTYNDSYFLDFILNRTLTSATQVRLVRYFKDNTTSTSYYQTISSPLKRWRIACGPYDINKVTGSATINSQVSYYTIELIYSYIVGMSTVRVPISEMFTFNVKEPKTFRTRISFLGLKGGIESFTFYHRNRTSYNIERKSYNKTLQSNYLGQLKYEVGDRGDSVYAVSAKQQNAVATYCDRETSEWLYEMWLSPVVWTYIRPDLYTFRAIVDGVDLKLWVDGEHGLAQDDYIFVFSDEGQLEGRFQVLYVNGNIITTDASWSTDLTGCGWVQKNEDWQTLPVVISDNSVEVKQRTSRPIEYSLSYSAAYQKTTLRG